MTDDERVELVERMADAVLYKAKQSGVYMSGLDAASIARTALSVAEPVVRADEREACCKALVAMSDVEPHPARSAALIAGASTIRLVAAHQDRARSAAAGEGAP